MADLRVSRRYLEAKTVVPTLSVAQLAYLAGLIDGEGSFSVRKRDKPATAGDRARLGYSLKLSIAGEPNHLIGLRTECGNLGNIWVRKRPGQRHLAEWIIAHREARVILAGVVPYMRLKRRQAELLLAMPQCRSRWEVTPEIRAEQETIRQEIQRLNTLGRGKKDGC